MVIQYDNYRRTGQAGFTIVELLIVIVVIAILAAITIVAYNGIQNRAYDSVVASDISAARKKLEMAKVDLGHYPQTAAQFNDFHFNLSMYDTKANNIYYITDTVNDTYALGLRSRSGKGYIATNKGVNENVTVSGAATATAIGVTWGAVGTRVLQGWGNTAAPPPVWNPTWAWTK